MKITDPIKRRVEFRALSMRMDTKTERLTLLGHDLTELVLLSAGDTEVSAVTSLTQQKLKIEKIQILGRQAWLTLDFDRKSEISRIVVDIAELDQLLLHSYLSALIGNAPLPYFNRSNINEN